ncbi:MAG: hypothetical protein IJO29_02915 [Oscillospiraceae bacterium]|nr:hypothetical protein [Oscillospiraceae bacterium]
MFIKKVLISLFALSVLSLSFVSCTDDDDKSSDSFTIEAQSSGSDSDPLNNSEPQYESSSMIVMHTTVYEDMESAYLSQVNGEVEQWEKYRETTYILLTDTHGATDTDGDGLPDAYEIEIYKTDPEKADTDGDGYDDCVEKWMNTDALTYNN